MVPMDAATDTRTRLIAKIEAFLAETGMGPSHLGQRAAVGSEVVKRLRSGGDVTTRSADKLNAFIDAWPNVPPFSRAAGAGRRREGTSAAQ